MPASKTYIYAMVAFVGLFLLFQLFANLIYYASAGASGAILFDLATICLATFVLLQGVWLYREKRDGIATVYLVLCTGGFLYMLWTVFGISA